MLPERQELIAARLREGFERAEIARELWRQPHDDHTLGAADRGFPDVEPRDSRTDWNAVRSHYEAGHSIEECRRQFGFTYGAWDKAVARGDLTPRSRSRGELSRRTRDQVEDLLAQGLNQAAIARDLGLSKSTVAYHARRLGIRADPRFARRHDWEAVQAAIEAEGLSMAECMRRFGMGRDTWYRAVKRGEIAPRDHLIPLDRLLVVGLDTDQLLLEDRLIRPARGRRGGALRRGDRWQMASPSLMPGRFWSPSMATASTTGCRTWSCCAPTAIRRRRTGEDGIERLSRLRCWTAVS